MNSRACLRVGNGMSDWFPVNVWLCQGSEMSPYLFNTYVDGVVRGINAGLLSRGLSLLREDGRECGLAAVCR